MTTTHLNPLALAEAFDALHTEWMLMPEGDARDDVVDRLNELAEAISAAPATTVEDAAAKARNLLWAFGLTHAGVPAQEDDPARYELVAFVEQFEALVSRAD